jgi:cyanophycinase-like exopeptidase
MSNLFRTLFIAASFLVVTALLPFPEHAFAQANAANKGHLVIIGGGPRPEAVMKKIITLAGGSKANIVVVPMASSEPRETGLAQTEQLRKLGVPTADFLFCTKETADLDSNIAKIRAATGIFSSHCCLAGNKVVG